MIKVFRNISEIISNRKSAHICVAIILLITCLITYLGSLHNDFIIDDFDFLGNEYHRTFKSLGDFFTQTESQHYIPVYYLINISLFRLFSTDPFPLRIISLFLFYLDSLLLFAFFNMLTKDFKVSLLACILFCVHPINANSVNYITSNFLFIFAIFMKISLMAFCLFLKNNNKKLYFYALSILFFIGALLSFEMAFLFPLYLAVILFFLKKFSLPKTIKYCTPFALLSFIYLILWLYVAGSNTEFLKKISYLNLTPDSYIASVMHLIGWYASNLIIPRNIVFIYNISPIKNLTWLWCIVFLGIAIGLFMLVTRLWKKEVKSFALVWFLVGFILLIPAAFAHAYMGLAITTHWFYFSSVGFFLLASMLLVDLGNFIHKRIWNMLIVSIIIFLFAYTQQYNLIARTEKSFCRFWLDTCPKNTIAQTTLGNVFLDEGKYEMALQLYNEVIESGKFQRYKEYTNIGLVYSALNRNEEAKHYLQKSIQLNPNFAAAYNALGNIYKNEGALIKAIHFYVRTIELGPYMAEPRLNLANLFIEEKNWQGALRTLESIGSIKIKPELQKIVLIKLAALSLKNGDPKKAFSYTKQLFLKFNEAESYLQLSQAFDQMNMDAIALEVLNSSLKIFPKEKEAYLLYGVILANQKRYKEAILIWRKGESLDSKDKRFLNNIEKANAELKKRLPL